jgi:hypothetical protein
MLLSSLISFPHGSFIWQVVVPILIQVLEIETWLQYNCLFDAVAVYN